MTQAYAREIESSRALAVVAAAAMVVITACGGATTGLGPLSIEVPDGWEVTRTDATNVQIADAAAAPDTQSTAGDAKAVFDIYLPAPIGFEEYRSRLRKDNVSVRSEGFTVDGYDAVRLSYSGAAVAGSQEAVFVPEWDVQIVYRAAFANDNASFLKGRSKFRAAVRSITFSK